LSVADRSPWMMRWFPVSLTTVTGTGR
jgi:hypothetical protein